MRAIIILQIKTLSYIQKYKNYFLAFNFVIILSLEKKIQITNKIQTQFHTTQKEISVEETRKTHVFKNC